MIVAADFSGFLDGHQLVWSLDAVASAATVDVRWNPRRPKCQSTRIAFTLPDICIPHSFATLQPRYPSPMDGSGVRSLTVTLNGQTYQCSVHGNPNLEDHPELEAFNQIWRHVAQLVDAEITSHGGG